MELNESLLSRIWRHTQEHDCVMVTAFRGSNSKEGNREANFRLISALKVLKIGGVTKVTGTYQERDPETDKAFTVKEESFFIVNKYDKPDFKQQCIRLGVAANQDSILYMPKGGKGAYLIGTNDTGYPGRGKEANVGDATYGKAQSDFLSRIYGRPFYFAEAEEMPIAYVSMFDAMWHSVIAKDFLSK